MQQTVRCAPLLRTSVKSKVFLHHVHGTIHCSPMVLENLLCINFPSGQTLSLLKLRIHSTLSHILSCSSLDAKYPSHSCAVHISYRWFDEEPEIPACSSGTPIFGACQIHCSLSYRNSPHTKASLSEVCALQGKSSVERQASGVPNDMSDSDAQVLER